MDSIEMETNITNTLLNVIAFFIFGMNGSMQRGSITE
jgi:hypothetical protein